MGTRGSDTSLSLFGVAGWLPIMGVLGLDASKACTAGRVLSAAA